MEVLLEVTEFVAPAGAVDVEAGIIRGVHVCGLESRNGRRYELQALQKAVKRGLYENRVVNIDHIDLHERRSLTDRIGYLQNARCTEKGIYADLHLNTAHSLYSQIAWAAQHAPSSLGLSHDAVGITVRRGNDLVVEEIDEVRSVDLVADPATTNGLFESMRGRFGGLPSWQDDPLPSGDFGKEREPELLCASWRDEAPREPEHEAALAEDYRQQQDQEAVERVRRWCADD